MKKACIPLLLLILPSLLFARGTYQEPTDFISQTFNGQPPKPSAIWVTGNLKEGVYDIMGRHLNSLRIRYWGKEQRSAWILEEIGKEHPITVGVVINQDKIEKIKVLIFRESRGGEVRHPFFTEQFTNITLTSDRELSDHIDGISGATLSVRALKNIAKLALYLHQHTPYSQ